MAVVGREPVGCACGSGGGTIEYKVGKTTRERCKGELNSAWEEVERR